MLNKVPLRALAMALAGGTVCLLTVSVSAQTGGGEHSALMEEVYITGSRIKRSDVTSSAPVTVLSSADLMTAGTPTIEDFIQDLPSISGGDFGSSMNNGSSGWATASLRGLGPVRTLVLINGRRPASVGPDGFVDLNTIPSSIVDRIEVLRDGASTIYGSDAIAGVINIITKKRFDGLEVDVQYDVTDKGDGESYLASLTFGTVFERGSVLLNGQYTQRADIWRYDRSFSRCAIKEVEGKRMCGGSGTTYPAHIAVGEKSYIVDAGTGQVRPFAISDSYNSYKSSYLITPQEVYSFFGSADYDWIEEGAFSTLTSVVEMGFANRVSDQMMAPMGTFWGATVGADHPDNPFGVNRTDGAAAQDVIVNRRLAEASGRVFSQDAVSWNAALAFDGQLYNDWTWHAAFKYSRYIDTQIASGRVNKTRLQTLLDRTACHADKHCPGLWDPFRINTLTPAMQDYALVTISPVLKSRMLQSQISLEGDAGSLVLPGGKPAWAVGYEHRVEKASHTVDGGAVSGEIYFVSAVGAKGDYSVNEFFTEISLPLFAGVFLLDELTVDVSARYSDYNFLDAHSTYKYGVNWAPTGDIRFRYTLAEGFRAPGIAERFSPPELTAARYNEPCLNYGAGATAVVATNCMADGLPANFSLTSSEATGMRSGNPDLKPEDSKSQNIGIVFTPSVVPDFTATLDYFMIEINNAIGKIGTDGIITGCYNSPGFSSYLCRYIHGPLPGETAHPVSPRRNVLNNIAGQQLKNENLATFETTGIDFDFTYEMNVSQTQVKLKWFGTWLNSYEYLPFQQGKLIDLAGKFGTDPYRGDSAAAFARWKSNLRVTLNKDQWYSSWTARYISGVDDASAKPTNLENTAGAVWYHDVQGGYTLDNVTFTVGVRNVFDKKPPYVTNYTDMNTLHFSYDASGRYFYTRISISL